MYRSRKLVEQHCQHDANEQNILLGDLKKLGLLDHPNELVLDVAHINKRPPQRSHSISQFGLD